MAQDAQGSGGGSKRFDCQTSWWPALLVWPALIVVTRRPSPVGGSCRSWRRAHFHHPPLTEGCRLLLGACPDR